jgi:hypothetical protein
MTEDELRLAGFRWTKEVAILLPSGALARIKPVAIRDSSEPDATTERARKALRYYTVTITEIQELSELEIEQLLSSHNQT